MATQAKVFSYAISLDRDGAATSDEGGSALPVEEAWSPEHLVLAGLARCTLTSLDYHAKRVGVQSAGSASASGEVTQRTTDRSTELNAALIKVQDSDTCSEAGFACDFAGAALGSTLLTAAAQPIPFAST